MNIKRVFPITLIFLLCLLAMSSSEAQILGIDIFEDSFETSDLPPDPSTIATPPDKGVVYDIFQTTGFLYSGPNRIQTGVAPGTIESRRVAVIRGRLLSGSGAPLRGARVQIHQHPEFGETLTRKDGAFDMVVNGGGKLVVKFAKSGHIPVQRQTEVPYRDFVVINDAIMAPLNSKVDTISANSGSMQIAAGSRVEDEFGSRKAVVMFPAGTTADMVMADGSRQSLSSMSVRTTEFTVGDMGPMAMPGDLPNYSGYTYAAEISVDEAMDAGATTVEFNQPVPTYVDNFLSFPAGAAVPSGYYDREKAVWVGSRDGVVLSILGVQGGLASIDSTGSGSPDTAQRLSDLGISDAERQSLASRYAAGSSIWRVPVTHLTPYDYNWARPNRPSPPNDISPDRPDGSQKNRTKDTDPCSENGSIVECQNQVLGQRLAITGTPYTLNYRSDRVPGYSDRSFTLPITGAEAPNADAITLRITVAGQIITEEFEPEPNLSYDFEWDSRDAYGRAVTGGVRARVQVGYSSGDTYCFLRGTARGPRTGFGEMCDNEQDVLDSRRIVNTSYKTEVVELQGWGADFKGSNIGLGSWTLDSHHLYDGNNGILYLGNGSRIISPDISGAVIRLVAGGRRAPLAFNNEEGEQALDADLNSISGLAVDADGTIYFSLEFENQVRRIDTDGRVFTIAGTGMIVTGTANGTGSDGDGGPAIDATLRRPRTLSLGSDGSLYINDASNGRIRRIDGDGIINTVAGGGTIPPLSPDADGALATDLAFNSVRDVEVGPNGTLYLWDDSLQRVFSVGPAGNVSALSIPGGAIGVNGDGEVFSASNGCLYTPLTGSEYNSYCYVDETLQPLISNLTFAEDDSVLITDAGFGGDVEDQSANGFGAGNASCLRQLSSPDNNATFVGTSVQDGFRVNEYIADPTSIKLVGKEADFPDRCENQVIPDQPPATAPAATSSLSDNIAQITTSASGEILVADRDSASIRSVQRAYGPTGSDDIYLSTETDNRVFRFDLQGRHLATFDPMTGAETQRFQYDSNGLLIAVIDVANNRTEIDRNGQGVPTGIVGPFGQRTSVTVNADGYLASISNPAGETHSVGYGDAGLLTRFTYPNGDISQYSYDGVGKLTGVSSNDGYAMTLDSENIDDGVRVTRATAGGATSSYEVTRNELGELTVINIDDAGARYVVERGTGSSSTTRRPTGMIQTSTRTEGSRFGQDQGGTEVQTVSFPSGRSVTIGTTRTVTRTNTADPLSPITIEQARTVAGNTEETVYNPNTRLLRRSTPEGRVAEVELDALGREIRFTGAAGMADRTITYDSAGRIGTTSFGTDVVTRSYDGLGRIVRSQDGAGRSTDFAYDSADRVTTRTTPGGRVYGFDYDTRGRLVQVTMPNGQTHAMAYNVGSELTAYTPPGSPAMTHSYDPDRRRTGTTLMDGRQQTVTYDAGFRSVALAYPEATSRFTFVGDTQLVETSTWDAAGSGIDYTSVYEYDGELLTAVVLNGERIEYQIDNAFRLASSQLNDLPAIGYSYDRDNLVTAVGPFDVDRTGLAGRPESLSDGTLSIDYSFDDRGRLSGRTHVVNGQTIYELDLTPEAGTGYIDQRVESVAGTSETRLFDYSADGELTSVSLNGSASETYGYDVNGNRTSANGESATYDAQDRIIQSAGTAFSFDASGMLTARGDDDFVYGSRGELLAANLGNGDAVTYSYDVAGRQVMRHGDDGTTHYLFADTQDAFRVTATRAPNGSYSQYYYDDAGVVFAMDRGGNLFYIGADHLGTPRVVADASGNVVKRIDYDSFGQVSADTAPNFELVIGFAGGLYDPQTKLVRFGLRDYDPSIGRWTSRDPLLFDSGQFNLYAYVGSNPVTFRDPSGLICVGGSVYAGPGVGAKLCYKDGKWSLCAEVGLGIGGGPSLDLMGSAAKRGDADFVAAEAGLGCGPFQLGGGLKLDDCGKFSKELSCRAGPFDPCKGEIDVLGETVGKDNASLLIKTARGKLGCKIGGAVKGGACIGSNI